VEVSAEIFPCSAYFLSEIIECHTANASTMGLRALVSGYSLS
jgi:hypothetical protein